MMEWITDRLKIIADENPPVAIGWAAVAGLFLSSISIVIIISVLSCCYGIISIDIYSSFPWIFTTGVATAPSLLLTWYWRTSHKKQDINNDSKRIFTDRFAKAVEQLGNEKTEIKIGGIYHLQKLANESREYHWPIMQTLTQFIRKNSPNINEGQAIFSESDKGKTIVIGENIPSEIQTAIDVICEREHPEWDEDRLDFSGSDLTGGKFVKSKKNGAIKHYAILNSAIFIGCCLNKAVFTNAELKSSRFDGSKGSNTCFYSAKLDNAVFANSEFTKTDFRRTTLFGTIFVKYTTDMENLVQGLFEELNFIEYGSETIISKSYFKSAKFDKRALKTFPGGKKHVIEAEGIIVDEEDVLIPLLPPTHLPHPEY